MINLPAVRRIALTFVVAAGAVAVTSVAVADTIYLKNGRTIRSASVRVEGERVIFMQYAGEVSIPLSMVDRIVEDETREPVATPTSVPAASGSADPAAPADPDATAADPDEETPVEQTREYWQDRVGAIAAEREEVELRIEDLKRTERAFMFSHRSTAETRESIQQAEERLVELGEEMRELEAEARRLQVPAGWLRIDTSGGDGGS